MFEDITSDTIVNILERVEKIFRKENNVIDVDSERLIIIGDIHGDLEAYKRIHSYILREKKFKVVFLGDLVDRGNYSIEVVINAFNLKLEDPKRIYILRGNHEAEDTNMHYGFWNELKMKFRIDGIELYKRFNEVFSYLPLIARADKGKLLMLHGGIPKNVPSLDEIKNIPRGLKESISNELLMEILWNDPTEDVNDYTPSYRGPGIFLFGKNIFEKFMRINKAKMLIRAHLFLPEGYKYYFNNRLLSIFSTLNYVYKKVKGKIVEYNKGEIMLRDVSTLSS